MPIHDWTRVSAGIFHDFHHEWVSTIKGALNRGLLPSDYYALAEQIAGGLGPNVRTRKSKGKTPAESSGNGPSRSEGANGGGLALATTPPKVRFTASAEVLDYARKRSRVAIRHHSDDAVVAMVEIVSPGNKSSQRGLDDFVSKACEVLDDRVHLLIVNLFPPGTRDPQGIHGAVWTEYTGEEFQLPRETPLTLVSYAAGTVKEAFIEPVAVGQSLPDMPLFLTPRRYVSLPLETTYQAAFEAVPQRWRADLA